MAKHSTSGRGRRQVMKGPDGKDYLVVEPMGNRLFTVRVDDSFYDDLDQIIKVLPDGLWSYGAVVRKLVREAAGRELPPAQKVKQSSPGEPEFLTEETKAAIATYSEPRQFLMLANEGKPNCNQIVRDGLKFFDKVDGK
jgi:hypothetical protein